MGIKVLLAALLLLLSLTPLVAGIMLLRQDNKIRARGICVTGKITDRQITDIPGQNPKASAPAYVQVTFTTGEKELQAWCTVNREDAVRDELEFYFLPENPTEIFPVTQGRSRNRVIALTMIVSAAAVFALVTLPVLIQFITGNGLFS